jgi:hypothetical protein
MHARNHVLHSVGLESTHSMTCILENAGGLASISWCIPLEL